VVHIDDHELKGLRFCGGGELRDENAILDSGHTSCVSVRSTMVSRLVCTILKVTNVFLRFPALEKVCLLPFVSL
jgi:hypothetical protein